MTYEHILVDVDDGVGILTLNRPDKLNAMNRKLSAELHDAVKAMDADDAVGCIVITGAGTRAFSAGGDIHEQREDDRRYTFEQLEAMREGRRAYDIAASAEADDRHDERPGVRRRGGAGVIARHAHRLRGHQVPLPRRRIRPHQQHLVAGRRRSAGRSPRSCCSPRASSKPRKRIASAC